MITLFQIRRLPLRLVGFFLKTDQFFSFRLKESDTGVAETVGVMLFDGLSVVV